MKWKFWEVEAEPWLDEFQRKEIENRKYLEDQHYELCAEFYAVNDLSTHHERYVALVAKLDEIDNKIRKMSSSYWYREHLFHRYYKRKWHEEHCAEGDKDD